MEANGLEGAAVVGAATVGAVGTGNAPADPVPPPNFRLMCDVEKHMMCEYKYAAHQQHTSTNKITISLTVRL